VVVHIPAKDVGRPFGTRTIEAGGATPMSPQNGLAGMATPGANSMVFLSTEEKRPAISRVDPNSTSADAQSGPRSGGQSVLPQMTGHLLDHLRQ